MRTLNDVLATDTDTELADVPLLASYQGEPLFTTGPFVALDPLLADTWKDHLPILDADRDLRRLHEALNLVVLDDPDAGMEVRPLPEGLDEVKQANVERTLAKAKPYLAALAASNAPSRKDDVVRGLKRLEVVACTDLVLRYEFQGATIDRPEATAFIAVRQEQVRGAVRRNIGTAHLEIGANETEPDWYTFGPQLADFLQVPRQGDGFAVLLKGTDGDRRQYLASRRIPMEAVEEMRIDLDQPVEDDVSDEIIDFPVGDELSTGPGPDAVDPDPRTEEETDATAPGDKPNDAQDPEPLPDLNPNGITMSDVEPGELQQRGGANGGGGGSLGPAGPADHEGSDRRRREIGSRGEEAAFEKEKQRVQAFGGDPTAVHWRSHQSLRSPRHREP